MKPVLILCETAGLSFNPLNGGVKLFVFRMKENRTLRIKQVLAAGKGGAEIRGFRKDWRSINGSLTVSSVQMEWTCVPNITEVKMRKRRPSKHRRMRRMTVAGGEKELHSGERRDKEEDVEGKRRWRHEEALLCWPTTATILPSTGSTGQKWRQN